MRLQLQPGDLGEIELRVRAAEGVIRGEVMVQHIEVKHLLDSQIERLREALEAQGMRLEGFDVGVSDDGAFAQDREADEAPSFAGLLGGESENETTATEVVSAVPRQPIQLSDDAVDWLV
jgi:flagellar hook-length control protein FliK